MRDLTWCKKNKKKMLFLLLLLQCVNTPTDNSGFHNLSLLIQCVIYSLCRQGVTPFPFSLSQTGKDPPLSHFREHGWPYGLNACKCSCSFLKCAYSNQDTVWVWAIVRVAATTLLPDSSLTPADHRPCPLAPDPLVGAPKATLKSLVSYGGGGTL